MAGRTGSTADERDIPGRSSPTLAAGGEIADCIPVKENDEIIKGSGTPPPCRILDTGEFARELVGIRRIRYPGRPDEEKSGMFKRECIELYIEV